MAIAAITKLGSWPLYVWAWIFVGGTVLVAFASWRKRASSVLPGRGLPSTLLAVMAVTLALTLTGEDRINQSPHHAVASGPEPTQATRNAPNPSKKAGQSPTVVAHSENHATPAVVKSVYGPTRTPTHDELINLPKLVDPEGPFVSPEPPTNTATPPAEEAPVQAPNPVDEAADKPEIYLPEPSKSSRTKSKPEKQHPKPHKPKPPKVRQPPPVVAVAPVYVHPSRPTYVSPARPVYVPRPARRPKPKPVPTATLPPVTGNPNKGPDKSGPGSETKQGNPDAGKGNHGGNSPSGKPGGKNSQQPPATSAPQPNSKADRSKAKGGNGHASTQLPPPAVVPNGHHGKSCKEVKRAGTACP